MSTHTGEDASMDKVVRVTRYVFRSPNPARSLALMVPLALLNGLLLWGASAEALLRASELLLLPATLASLLAVPMLRAVGGSAYLRRTFLLGLISLLTALPLSALGCLLQRPYDALSVTAGVYFFLWHSVFMATAENSHMKVLPSSALPSALTAAVLWYTTGTAPLEPVLCTASFAAGALLFIELARVPIKRNYGADGLVLCRRLLDHWTERGTAGVREMEEFFSGDAVEVHGTVKTIGLFSEEDGSHICSIVVPFVHPGPLGNIGGSNLPEKLCTMTGLPLMVLHSASTHDLNPVSTDEVRSIADAVQHGTERGGASEVITEGSFKLQRLAGATLVLYSPYPDVSDDIHQDVGLLIEDGTTVLADAHNCMDGTEEVVFPRTRRALELVEHARDALRCAHSLQERPFSFGYGQHIPEDPMALGMGPMGVQACVFEVDGARYAYILIDGNGLMKPLREEILSELDIKDGEVLTTDNHVCNMTMGGFNPVGAKIGRDELLDAVKRAYTSAAGSLKPAYATYSVSQTSVRAFGHGGTSRLTAVINSTTAILKYGAAAGLSLSAALSVLVTALL